MKKICLTIFLAAVACFVNAQATNMEKDTAKDKTSFQYLLGKQGVTDLKVCSYSTGNEAAKKTFSNGRSAPILQVYVLNKSQYVGGILENEKGKKTVINDIVLAESGKTLLFTVVGKDFSMSFTLERGCILKESEDVTVFNTDGVGIWKINKKK